MALLEVDSLRKVFRTRRFGRVVSENAAVDDVSFQIEAGRTLAVVGESGAGKSTVGRLVLRLIEPDSGGVRLDGEDLLSLGGRALRRRRQRMQMVFQDPYSALDPRLSIAASVAEPLRVHSDVSRLDRDTRTLELLRRVGLGSHHLDRRPHELSGGQLQRVSIARALATDPDLIVCDEAVAALDVSVRAQILNLLQELQEEHGLAYMFIAHDLAIVEAFAHDILVMQNGRVVERGRTADVFEAPAEAYTRELLAAVPIPDPRRRRRSVAPPEGESVGN